MNLETFKVLDIQDRKIPENIRKTFFDNQSEGYSNDIYIDYHFIDEEDEMDEFDIWVRDNTNVESEEIILIKYWW